MGERPRSAEPRRPHRLRGVRPSCTAYAAAVRHRHDRLVAALAEQAPHIEVTGVAAGLRAVLRLPPGTERSTVKAAVWQGIALDGLAVFRHPEATETDMPVRDGLVVGFATPSEHAYGAALEALCGVLPPGQEPGQGRRPRPDDR